MPEEVLMLLAKLLAKQFNREIVSVTILSDPPREVDVSTYIDRHKAS